MIALPLVAQSMLIHPQLSLQLRGCRGARSLEVSESLSVVPIALTKLHQPCRESLLQFTCCSHPCQNCHAPRRAGLCTELQPNSSHCSRTSYYYTPTSKPMRQAPVRCSCQAADAGSAGYSLVPCICPGVMSSGLTRVISLSSRCRHGRGGLIPRLCRGFRLLHVTAVEPSWPPHELRVRALLCDTSVGQERDPVSLQMPRGRSRSVLRSSGTH